MQADPQGVYWGLRFSAYFPCVIREGRYVVIEATVFQPEPRYQPAYILREVTSTAVTSTEGIGWGADVGISQRTHWGGESGQRSYIFAEQIVAECKVCWCCSQVHAAVNPECT